MKYLLGALLLLAPVPTLGQSVDLALLGGKVVDGTGSAARTADVLVRGDTIVFVGRADRKTLRSRMTVDAANMIVAPGFIDSHAHGNPLEKSPFDNFLLQGITTIVLGQDGVSPQDEGVEYTDKLSYETWTAANSGKPVDFNGPVTLAAWMRSVEEKGLALNIAPLSGFGTNRALAGAKTEMPLTPEQGRRALEILEADLAAGAFGISNGLEYVPDRYSTKSELLAAAELVGKHGGIVMSHMRSEDSDKIAASIDELLAQGKAARVHISHLKIVFATDPREADAVLKKIRAARIKGYRISADVYPYYAGYADMTLVYPAWAKRRDQWDEAVRTRRNDLEMALEENVMRRNGPEAILIASGPYAGKTLKEVASDKNLRFVDVLIDVFGFGGPAAAHRIMLPAVQDRFVSAADTAISTDGGPWINHPRSWGSFPEVLERFVRARKLLSLESAVHKMTGLPAEVIGLRDRGEVAVGKKADLVVFDPARIHNRASWTEAAAPPEGIRAVIVNGEVAASDGKRTEAKSGHILKRPGARP